MATLGTIEEASLQILTLPGDEGHQELIARRSRARKQQVSWHLGRGDKLSLRTRGADASIRIRMGRFWRDPHFRLNADLIVQRCYFRSQGLGRERLPVHSTVLSSREFALRCAAEYSSLPSPQVTYARRISKTNDESECRFLGDFTARTRSFCLGPALRTLRIAPGARTISSSIRDVSQKCWLAPRSPP